MPTLIFRGSDGREQKQELASELSVGREAGNDVVLTEQGVSRKHCRFFVDEGGAVWVEDLGSANGVLVGGERIGEATQLSEGLEVAVGGCTVKLAAARRATSARVPANGARKGSTALAKPDGAGGNMPVKRATRMMAAGEAPRRARPIAKAPPPRDARPVLRGMAGPFQGQTFQLDKGKLTVGRVPPADIQLEDDSVSRRHAEILKTGSKFSVRDLGSANGTFLNGDRVSEAPLEPGDVVRFGVIELAFAGPGGVKVAKAVQGTGGSKKKLILGIVGVALLGLVVFAIVGGGKKPQPSDGPLIIQPPPEADAPKMMGRCQAYSDPESPEYNLESCVKSCGKVDELDPTLGAKKRVKFCKKEQEAEAKLKTAATQIATGQEEEGIKTLIQIERGTAVFPRAKAKFDEAAGILAKKFKNQCKGEVFSGRFEDGYNDSCRKVLELTCNKSEGPDSEALNWFQHAAKQTGKGKGEYKCPPEYRQFQNLGGKEEDPVVKAEAAIRAKYPNPRIADAILTYYMLGRPKQQSNALKNERSRASGKDKVQFNELIMLLDIIDGRWNTAQEPIRMGKANDALLILKEAFDADAKLLPAGFDGALMLDAKSQIAKIFYDMAKDEFSKEHYDKCFNNVYKGYKLNPKNTDLAGYMGRMEREANRRINDSPDCDKIESSLQITAPESSVHKKALEIGRKMNCPGLEEGKPEAEP